MHVVSDCLSALLIYLLGQAQDCELPSVSWVPLLALHMEASCQRVLCVSRHVHHYNLQGQNLQKIYAGRALILCRSCLQAGGSRISFALTAPGLVIFSVSNVTGLTPVDSYVGPGAQQVGNGRVPVFSGGPNDIGNLTIQGCNGSRLYPSSQYLVQYWIRDKFATMDTVVQVALLQTGA